MRRWDDNLRQIGATWATERYDDIQRSVTRWVPREHGTHIWHLAAPRDGTWKSLMETSDHDKSIMGKMDWTLDLSVNDIGTKTT